MYRGVTMLETLPSYMGGGGGGVDSPALSLGDCVGDLRGDCTGGDRGLDISSLVSSLKGDQQN